MRCTEIGVRGRFSGVPHSLKGEGGECAQRFVRGPWRVWFCEVNPSPKKLAPARVAQAGFYHRLLPPIMSGQMASFGAPSVDEQKR